MDSTKNFNIFRNMVLFTGFLLVLFVVFQIKSILILFFVAFIIASALNPFINLLSKKLPRKVAVIIFSITAAILTFLIIIPLLSIFIKQAIMLMKYVPFYWAKAQAFIFNWIETRHIGISNVVDYVSRSKLLPNLSGIISTASGVGQNILSSSLAISTGLLGVIVFSFLLLIITLYMMMDKNYLLEKTLEMFPASSREKTKSIMVKISKKVGGFVIGQIVIMLTIGIVSMIVFTILGIKFSLILGVIAGLFDIIPLIGPLLSVLIIGIVAFAQKPILALWAILAFILIQWLTDTFVRPAIMSKFLDLHPLTLIFSFLVGGILFGTIGVILAPAIAATICVLIDELYKKRIKQ